MIDPEANPNLFLPIDEDAEREYELKMHDLAASVADAEAWAEKFGNHERNPLSALEELKRLRDREEFEEKLLEAMTTPIDPRNMEPTSFMCGLRIEIDNADPEAAD
ncbi:hypothetical protein SEA_ZOOMAN_63 [Microbacterium phage Zooman]|nr:hypothetical protein SEA_ZOOMAN_63 [Microbacterium phage Zooman]